MTIPAVAPEICDLVRRAARLPHGFAFLEFGPPDCVAGALGVPVPLVEDLRAALARPEERAALLEAYERATEVQRAGGQPSPQGPGGARPAGHGPEELIEAARGHALGLDFLIHGPLETVAMTFAVHPVIVLGAREILGRAGAAAPHAAEASPDHPEDEGLP